jgi:transcriptional regulator NrdR family protein
MNIKVNNSSSVKKAGKTSKSQASSAEGLGFASALEQAQSANQVETKAAVSSVDAVNPFLVDTSDQTPAQSKQRGYYILDLLEELEKDILSGKETKVTERLEKALQNPAVDKDSLPAVVRELMDEIDSRAAIELEKLKS